jgi:CBS domain-containing protein
MAIKASDIMSRNVITAAPDDTIRQIAKIFVEHAISAVPICDDKDHVLGIISEGDILLPLRRSAVQRRTRWLDLLAEGDSLSQDFIDYLKETGRHADQLMTKDVISATEETSLSELAELMVDRKIKRIPILHDGHLVGIVSRADIVKALANNPDAES